MISAEDLTARMAGIVPIGLDADGATTRLAWTEEDAAAGEWFAEQAARCGLRVRRDPAGNRWAVPDAPAPWWAVGSHLDSVRAGGRYDGALGVAAGFAVAAAAAAPVAVIAFADEEGARFNTPTFGSRALAGRLDVQDALARTDADGVTLAEAMAAAGVDPAGLPSAPEWAGRLCGFLELHIDQTRDVADAGQRAAAVRALAARRRLEVELRGRADHAGTTRRHERRDALLAAARLIVRADELAGDDPDLLVTAGRIVVEPNAPTTVPARVRLWLDARAPDPARLDAWQDALELPRASARVAARSDGVVFPPAVRAAFGLPADVLCFAGHDAGNLADLMPAGMVLVRNPTGISHAPEERVAMDDAAEGAAAILRAVEALA